MGNIIVIDDFLDDPEFFRKSALKWRGIWSKKGNHPGLRSEHISKIDLKLVYQLHDSCQEKMSGWYSCQRSMFQYCMKSDGSSWIHQDKERERILIIYLTPNPPENSGTIFYNSNNSKDIKRVVENEYNRALIYDSTGTWHKSNHYFGDSIETSRLFLINFMSLGGSNG